MKKSSEFLKEVATQLNPSLVHKVSWHGIWERPLETGAAFEWTVFLSILSAASETGWSISYPLLNDSRLADLFTLRNELPIQHGAQAGHSSSQHNEHHLVDRFLAALVPKAVLSKDGSIISIFREGFPYHAIMSDRVYLDRPDIVLAPGNITAGFPRQLGKSSLIDFSYHSQPLETHGQLHAISTNLRPIRKRMPAVAVSLPVIEIIECSVNKTSEMLREQAFRYNELFSSPSNKPKIFGALGNQLTDSLGVPTGYIDLSNQQTLLKSFLHVGREAVQILNSDSVARLL